MSYKAPYTQASSATKHVCIQAEHAEHAEQASALLDFHDTCTLVEQTPHNQSYQTLVYKFGSNLS